jgi:diaminopimelate decarboxylase
VKLDEIVKDIFETMPGRLEAAEVEPEFEALIGFEIGDQAWTVEVGGRSCRARPGRREGCEATLRTGAREWIDVAAHAAQPTALFLAGKLHVEGDIQKLLTAFGLFQPYASDQVQVKDSSWVVETLGDFFGVREDGCFMIEDLDCVRLAEEFGTPVFVTSEGQLRQNYRRVREALAAAYPENDVNVMWAIKSNTSMALRKILNQEGAGGDCFTPGEIHATFTTGADPELFVLNGSDRSEEAFRMAIEIGLRITLDHLDDLEIVERLAREKGKKVRALIRVKCDLPSLVGLPSTFVPGITVPFEALNAKFGVTYAEAVEIAKAARGLEHLSLEGLHSHIGRDVHLPEHWRGYARDMVALCKRFRGDTGVTAEILDLGGGFAEKRDPSGHDLMKLAAPAEEYARAVAEGVREGCAEQGFPFPRLWIEPGRNLVGPTTVMISRVGNVKRTPGVCTWVHVDASCNFLPTVNRHNGASYHLLVGTRARARDEEVVDVVGPNCSGDLIQPRRRLPRLERGDLLIFLDVGAYNSVAANQFNCIPRPPCVLVSGARADLICERETMSDVFAHQRIPARLMA